MRKEDDDRQDGPRMRPRPGRKSPEPCGGRQESRKCGRNMHDGLCSAGWAILKAAVSNKKMKCRQDRLIGFELDSWNWKSEEFLAQRRKGAKSLCVFARDLFGF